MILVAMAYVIFMVKESVVKDTTENDNRLQLKLDKGSVKVLNILTI